MTAHKPATPLPWSEPVNYGASKFEIQGASHRLATIDTLPDAAYIAHACNAYPKLVEALRQVAGGKPYAKRAADLLRDLGEAE